jgi:hypothetical protein
MTQEELDKPRHLRFLDRKQDDLSYRKGYMLGYLSALADRNQTGPEACGEFFRNEIIPWSWMEKELPPMPRACPPASTPEALRGI